jgi:hypothetical protein
MGTGQAAEVTGRRIYFRYFSAIAPHDPAPLYLKRFVQPEPPQQPLGAGGSSSAVAAIAQTKRPEKRSRAGKDFCFLVPPQGFTTSQRRSLQPYSLQIAAFAGTH